MVVTDPQEDVARGDARPLAAAGDVGSKFKYFRSQVFQYCREINCRADADSRRERPSLEVAMDPGYREVKARPLG